MSRVHYGKYGKPLLAIVALVLAWAVWMAWLRDPAYATVCGPPPCAAELAVRQTLRERFGGGMGFAPSVQPPRPRMGQTPSVWAGRPVFTGDFRRARVEISRFSNPYCEFYALELRLRGDSWIIGDNEPLISRGFCVSDM